MPDAAPATVHRTPPPAIAAVILTRGDRDDQLRRTVASVQPAPGADGPAIDVLVVVNGPADVAVPQGARRLDLGENTGIPGGRNHGVAATTAPLVAFVDDDGEMLEPDALARTAALFERDPHLAVVSWRIVDDQGATARRHVPRPGAASALQSGPVAGFLGGACMIRRTAFAAAGGYAAEFFYAMEETDLAWRLADLGWSLWYAADITMRHPRTEPSRHPDALARTARNRAWAAHRNLPLPVAAVHLTVWCAASLRRNGLSGLRTTCRATAGALRRPLGPRRPMRWRTVWRLSRLGRPPVI